MKSFLGIVPLVAHVKLFTLKSYLKSIHNFFRMCCRERKVSVHTQAIDSAPVKGKCEAWILWAKVPEEILKDILSKIRAISARIKKVPQRKSKVINQIITNAKSNASKKNLEPIASRNKKWEKDQTTTWRQYKEGKYYE